MPLRHSRQKGALCPEELLGAVLGVLCGEELVRPFSACSARSAVESLNGAVVRIRPAGESPTYHRRCFPSATWAMSTSGTS